MSDQTRTEQRNGIGRREHDFELPALRLQYAELVRTVAELRVQLKRMELDVLEIKALLKAGAKEMIEAEIKEVLKGLL